MLSTYDKRENILKAKTSCLFISREVVCDVRSVCSAACLWRNTPALSLSVPEKVSALEGSCVVIPCSLSPVSSTQIMEVLVKRSSSVFILKKTVFSSHRIDVIHPDYRNRVSLAGNISSGDCSIVIGRIRKEDQNTYDLQLREPGQRSPTAETKIDVSVMSMLFFNEDSDASHTHIRFRCF